MSNSAFPEVLEKARCVGGQPDRPTKIWVIAAGLLLLQLAWALTIPPFRGIDEFDHVYRADAAAHGQLLVAPANATRGTGAWLDVRSEIVDAARSECQRLPYTTPNDCVGTNEGPTTKVASGAGRYHPLFYVVVGTPARVFDGVSALYAMRVATAFLALGLFIMGLGCIKHLRARSRIFAAATMSCTPVLIYSTSIVSPNGIELMAALAFWLAMMGLFHSPTFPKVIQLWTAGLAGSVLCTARPLGPLWCLLIAGIVLAASHNSLQKTGHLLRRRTTKVVAAVIAMSAVQSSAWVLAMGALKVGSEGHFEASLGAKLLWSVERVPLWILQSIAAFPFRDQPTHPVVYASYLLALGTLAFVGIRAASARLRNAILLCAALSIALPVFSTVFAFETSRGAWQGRYGLPLSIGVILLAGWALDRLSTQGTFPRVGTPMRLVWLFLFVAAQSVSIGYTLSIEARESPLANTASWIQPTWWVVALMSLTGSGLMCLGWLRGRGVTRARD